MVWLTVAICVHIKYIKPNSDTHKADINSRIEAEVMCFVFA